MNDDIVKFNIGTDHVVAVSTHGALYSWGVNDENQMLTNKTEFYSTPKKIPYFAKNSLKVVDADTGDKHTVVLDSVGNVYTFGSNSLG